MLLLYHNLNKFATFLFIFFIARQPLTQIAKIKKTKNNLEFFSGKSDRSERYTILITGEISQYRLIEIAQLFDLIENIKNLFTILVKERNNRK